MDGPLLSVVIVNFNGAHFLPECLGSLCRQTLPRFRYEVIVVDNGSADGSAELVSQEYPEVRLIAARENLGFAGGNNLGVEVAHGDLIVLMNNDAVADPHWLEELLAAREETGADAVVSKLVFHADPNTVNSAGLKLLRDGRGADLGFRQPDDGRFEQIREVYAGCGAGVMFRKPPEGEPLFDRRLFMYYEDLDRGWADRLAGRSCVYQPRALLRHVHCGSSGEWSPFFTFHVERNRVLVTLKNADWFLAVWTLLGFLARVGRSGWRWASAGFSRPAGGRFRATVAAARSLARLTPSALMDRYTRRRGWL